MSGTRVLRVYHSAVVDEYRERERLLRDEHGFDVHLVCPPAWTEGSKRVEATPDPSVPTYIVPVRGRDDHPILFWYASRELRRVIREVQPEIVDLHEEPYSLAVAAALRVIDAEAPGAKVCMYTAQNILKRYPQPFRHLEKRAYRRTSAMYPCSTEAAEVLRAKGYPGRVDMLPLGVAVPGAGSRASGRPRVGFVGRLEPYKGAHVALEAFASVAQGVDAEMTLVGSGPQEAELRAQAVASGVAQRVTFLGSLSQREALEVIGELDVLLAPSIATSSWKEQFGRVAAQAMVAGTLVIASDSGSLREVVGDAGLLVPEGDPAALATALRRTLEDPGVRHGLAAMGRARALTMFTWSTVSAGMADMYRDVLTEVGRAEREADSLGRQH